VDVRRGPFARERAARFAVARRFCLLWNPDQGVLAERALLTECLGPRAETPEPLVDLRAAAQQTEKAVLPDLVGFYRSRQELARTLGIDRSTLWRKLRKHHMMPDR
jgi:transcriptional regulator of acetoin/glycerol metabolism